MKLKNAIAVFVSFFAVGFALAQDLGPQIRKLEDGVYVYVGKNFNSNCGIVLTREGVVLIDSGHNPTDSRAILEAVKKLTPLPVRFLIDTEPHPDHTTGHFVFSPPAAIIAAEGAGASMRSYVVNRLLQCRHSRRRRIASPVSESRESTTLESAVPQNGHLIARHP